MARSDTDEQAQPTVTLTDRTMPGEGSDSVLDKFNDATIQSGQFMVSTLDEEETEESEDKLKVVKEIKGYDFRDAAKDTKETYQFGNKNADTMQIDASLTKLFQCMTLAYRYFDFIILREGHDRHN